MSILVVIRLKFFKDFRSLLIKLLSTNYLLQNDWVNVNQSLQIACLGEICQTEGSYLSTMGNERKSEQAHIPHAPTLLENAVYNEWQFHALGTGNRTKKGI